MRGKFSPAAEWERSLKSATGTQHISGRRRRCASRANILWIYGAVADSARPISAGAKLTANLVAELARSGRGGMHASDNLASHAFAILHNPAGPIAR